MIFMRLVAASLGATCRTFISTSWFLYFLFLNVMWLSNDDALTTTHSRPPLQYVSIFYAFLRPTIWPVGFPVKNWISSSQKRKKKEAVILSHLTCRFTFPTVICFSMGWRALSYSICARNTFFFIFYWFLPLSRHLLAKKIKVIRKNCLDSLLYFLHSN